MQNIILCICLHYSILIELHYISRSILFGVDDLVVIAATGGENPYLEVCYNPWTKRICIHANGKVK